MTTTVRSSTHQRLLQTASDLFYHEGIRAIGVDTISAQSRIGKATLYRHFATKDELIVAYLAEKERLHWEWFEEILAKHEGAPKKQLEALFEASAQLVGDPDYRGCAFLNALAEFSDSEHPAHQRAINYYQTSRARLIQLSQQAGARDPEALADQLLLLLNGALASAPIFGSSGPNSQLKTLASQLIEHQLEQTDSAQEK
ncbi:TetR/AcrR family transcriptional regulator [Ktedonosporobacter rubrisoli]|uniref:TetR/AcrR family transcriptional regulator n=1 Tax=Ktedonosporobacter rubrisoli TaxID=2509675 RepID=A0A4V0YY95_KTERU|nr:TetR/AcrR family transcriptional regulator [Ktedonosporobacter rubrisoli]QBD75441.1 TetR/AcrR family transcriptional regulator [Ktedonosporobacter rubrisoli]